MQLDVFSSTRNFIRATRMAVYCHRDDDVETPDRSHKPIPDWARSHKLYEALKAQQHTDPDTIFGARQTTCDLADMFAGELCLMLLKCLCSIQSASAADSQLDAQEGIFFVWAAFHRRIAGSLRHWQF